MKLAQLRRIPEAVTEAARIRGTDAQDAPVSTTLPLWRRHRLRLLIGAAALVVLLFAWLIHGWLRTGQVISRERLRISEVTRGHFVRDVAADGTVVASVNPTLFAVAPGTISYKARAGDAIKKGDILATLDSP